MSFSFPIKDSPSVIIRDLHPIGISIFPLETETPLVVDPDAVLSCSITGELLQPVCGGKRNHSSSPRC